MDYTTIQEVTQEGRIKEVDGAGAPTNAAEKALLNRLITRASRRIDHHCTGRQTLDANNYFYSETKTAEPFVGWLNSYGDLTFYLHKPYITAVTAISWTPDLGTAYADLSAADLARCWIDGSPLITVRMGIASRPQKVYGKITYAGGLSATPAGLPDDLRGAATMLTLRLYRMGETGMSDEVGVTDLGTIIYTTALPIDVVNALLDYVRAAPWSYAP
jgi:hypothetical protein